MDDALLVRGRESVGKRRGDLEEPLDGKPTLGDEAVERLALGELHGQEMNTLGLLDRIHGNDAGVVEGGQCLRLAPEALESLGVRRHLRPQNLERDVAAELQVAGPEHFAHSTGAKDREDLVVANASAGLEQHRHLLAGTRCFSSSNQFNTTWNSGV